MKRRKRTSTTIPAKGRLKDMADRLWSLAVRADWAERCAACRSGDIQAHHLIPRQHESLRYALENGIALCARHHQFDPLISPHQNAAGFVVWLRDHYPESHRWYLEQVEMGIPPFLDLKSTLYYCQVLRDLRQYVDTDVYSSVVGVRFGRTLDNP